MGDFDGLFLMGERSKAEVLPLNVAVQGLVPFYIVWNGNPKLKRVHLLQKMSAGYSDTEFLNLALPQVYYSSRLIYNILK